MVDWWMWVRQYRGTMDRQLSAFTVSEYLGRSQPGSVSSTYSIISISLLLFYLLLCEMLISKATLQLPLFL